MAQKRGHIIIQSGVNVWPHELKTAQAFTAQGKTSSSSAAAKSSASLRQTP